MPFVQKGAGSQWHNFVVRMYLDDLGAIAVGNLHYGYAKEQGSFQDNRPQAFFATVGGNNAFWSDSQSLGAWRPSAQAETDIANYKEMQAILAMPVIGHFWTGLSYVCSYFDFDYSNANVAPIAIDHAYHGAFTPGMPGGTLWRPPGRGHRYRRRSLAHRPPTNPY